MFIRWGYVFCHAVYIYGHLCILACGRSRRRITGLYRLQSTPPQRCAVARPLHFHLAGMTCRATQFARPHSILQCRHSMRSSTFHSRAPGSTSPPLAGRSSRAKGLSPRCVRFPPSLRSKRQTQHVPLCETQGKNTRAPITDGASQTLPLSLSNY